MSAYPITTKVRPKTAAVGKAFREMNGDDPSLQRALDAVHAIVPPLWPLADYVAVNPCVGLTDHRFLDACRLLRNVRDCELLMSRDYFRHLYEDGHLSRQDIAEAHAQCVDEHPEWYEGFEFAELIEWLTCPESASDPGEVRFQTVAEAVDRRQGSSWSSHIINDITRYCAAHYDEGQAAWVSPWAEATLYAAWREGAQLSRRMEFLGLPRFRDFVAGLPDDPRETIQTLLTTLEVPQSHWPALLLCEAFSVAGWASYIRYRVREAESDGRRDEDLIGLIAIRLAYDAALTRSPAVEWPVPLWPSDVDVVADVAVPPPPSADLLARHALQVAVERTYRRGLLRKLASGQALPKPPERKALQMIFCIDVRSEVMRRHLEAVHDSIETFGFAGFFGIPLEYVPFGAAEGIPQCPVLLRPTVRVHERLRGDKGPDEAEALKQRVGIRRARGLWKWFRTSAISSFSFVESLGLGYLAKLLTDSLHWTRPVAAPATDGLNDEQTARLGPDSTDLKGEHPSTDDRRIDLAEGLLRNLGLVHDFAPLVVLCGHACDVTNNPYRAALDCGACGGHSGEPNARTAAALLNDPEVRIGLAARGIAIPADTWFLGAVHNTTTDEITIRDRHLVPATHANDLERMEQWFREAGQGSRAERAARLGVSDPDDLVRRSRDWAEVRPEWGLAGNAAFVVAPRWRTTELNLEGRTFLHSYDHRLDPEGKVLELIMTAPMVVTNWINMQYYASSADPVAYGSGNKTIHNVVGMFGVLQGNGGDLMTGLPWQSIHDGDKLQHEPLRLLVIIDAPRSSLSRIIERHAQVRHLVTNGWVSLLAWEGDDFHRWTAQGTWEPLNEGPWASPAC